ncbi:MAG: hypothetical protein GY856_48265, partial [bacterium]|nr:hypothetical protein [bacterium]
ADPAAIWQHTPAELRPRLGELVPAPVLARIETNLHRLDPDEVRFLARYGPPLPGAPDPRDLLDMLSLTGLPPFTRLALSQTLRLLPQVAGSPTVGGVQRFPEGGYEGLARSGSLDSLHPTELAYPEPLFLHRVLNREALYYGRESPRQRRRELAYVILQTGWGLGGDGQIMARALLLALAQTLRRRGYEVVYSFAGRSLSEPGPLTSPAHVARVLHHQEAARTDEEAALNGVHGHLRTWHETFPGRQVLWIIGEHFDADHYDQHSSLYAALHAETGQQAWFIHVGPASTAIRPPAADLFRTWQVMSTETIWEDAATERQEPAR